MSGRDPTGPDRLSGWKEIAEHLRRSVRSAQRWEHELGLPVHRVQTLKGQVVYASRSELDTWLVNHQASVGETDESKHPSEPPVVARPPDVEASTSADTQPIPSLWWSLGGVTGVALVIAIGFWMAGQSGATTEAPLRRAQFLEVIGRSIEARSPNGAGLWSLAMDADVRSVLAPPGSGSSSTASVASLDLLGDGRLVHLVPVAFGVTDDTSPRSDALLGIDDEGQLLWQSSSDLQLSCGGQNITGPWRISDVAVSRSPGTRRVWVSYKHHTHWQSFVLEVTPTGASSLKYVQAGWVMSLAEWQTERGNVLVAGGVLNERQRASVALIDLEEADGRVSVMPASAPAYACEVADAIPPVQAFAFPPYDLNASYDVPYTMVERMSVMGTDLRAEIDSSLEVAMLGPEGRVLSLAATDLYRSKHDALAHEGQLDHSADECPDLTGPREIWTWTAGEGWQASFVGRAGPR